MKLQQWEATIQQMVEECNLESKDSGKYKVLTAWRAKLALAPHNLQPFQIDEIVRKVREKFMNVSPQSGGNVVMRPHFVPSSSAAVQQ
ncbi:MAG: hypothetical protein JWM11_6814 [Planctomycetaceae bacterium]|nr:hypothetical protein [Planctomycetaceae bacterium]